MSEGDMLARKKSQFLLYIHGYNVTEGTVNDEIDEVYRRLFWNGFRGNLVGLTWRGSEGWVNDWALSRSYAENVENAFLTSPRVMEFIRDKVRGEWQVSVEDVRFMAHSLGTQVATDAMRLYQVESPGSKLVDTLTLVEPAVWGEMFWPAQDVTYTRDNRKFVYGADPNNSSNNNELRRNSWVAFFNQSGHKAIDSVNSLINSYNRNDYALWAMVVDDHHLRNPGDHWSGRKTPDSPRVVVPTGILPGFDARDLSHQIPAMLKPTHVAPPGEWMESYDEETEEWEMVFYKPEYLFTDIEPPQGMQSMGITTKNINAETQGGFNPWSHNGHKGGVDRDLAALLNDPYAANLYPVTAILGLLGPKFVMSLPEVWQWYDSRLAGEAFKRNKE